MLIQSFARRIAWLGLVLTSALVAAAPLVYARSGRETDIETRLFAPCCYIQTLDVHESELADKLRREIHLRLEAGEAPAVIEEDLVRRFGENIRAVPAEADPRSWIPVLVGASMLLVFAALLWLGLRWSRPRRSRVWTPESTQEEVTRYDAALDRELNDCHRGDAA